MSTTETDLFTAAAIHDHFDTVLVDRIHEAIDAAAAKHGVRRRPLGTDPGGSRVTIDLGTLRPDNDEADATALGAPWMWLAGEEYGEAYTAHTPADTIEEALQAIQLLVSMIADIETREGGRA